MFGFFRMFGLAGNHGVSVDTPRMEPQFHNSQRAYAPGTRIPYDPALVSRLRQEHTKMLRLFGGMMRNLQELELEKVEQHLTQFEKTFNSYLLLELTRLYVFLDCCMKSDPKRHALIMGFRRKMNMVSRNVRGFVRTWKGQIVLEKVGRFSNEAKDIAQDLFARIKEESDLLFKIYEESPRMLRRESTI